MNKLLIERLRLDTPGCNNILHLNNAGAALQATPIITAIKDHLDLEANLGGYEAADMVSAKIENFYDVTARLLNCSRDEIAFVDNATRAWDMLFYSFKFNKGDKILTAICEYASNYLAFLQMAKRTGVEIVVIQNDASGQLDITDLQAKIDKNVKLIAITHIPTNGGLINPAIEVGKIAKQWNIPYLLDATQSIGQMPIDVQVINCDFLCATGRKYLRGPRGTGFLYIRSKYITQLEPPFIDLHAATWIADNQYELRQDALRFETWEQNYAAKIGLTTAIEYVLNLGLESIWQRIQYLATELRTQLSELAKIELCDLGINQCGIITFICKEKTPAQLKNELAKHKINVSISLQEYARLDMANRNIPALIRASVHYYNTEEEIAYFTKTLAKIIN